MRVELDQERCQGHNRCYALAPEIFDVDDYGTAILLNDGVVPAGLEDKAALAIANCPEFAISIAGADESGAADAGVADAGAAESGAADSGAADWRGARPPVGSS